jgi:tRNA-splicing ligase RtcB
MSALDLVEQLDEYRWRIPRSARSGMRVPGVVFATRKLLEQAAMDKALEQVINVSFLPGIIGASLAMPDIHWGYGFPIGGVAAMEHAGGVVSPGGVGYDISCGVRLVRSNLESGEVAGKLEELARNLAQVIPKGLGTHGRLGLQRRELEQLLKRGVPELVAKGIGWDEDLEYIEEGGAYAGADPGKVSERAFERGKGQVGTLGSGNHFLEVQVVDSIYDDAAAGVLGLFRDQVVTMIHSGSRGFGHQVATDYIRVMNSVVTRERIELPDRQLVCAPLETREARDYLAAMACAANFALCNREAMTHFMRQAFSSTFGGSDKELGLSLLYDVSHNLAKPERHVVEGKEHEVMVHRKGATRAFGPGRPEVPSAYRETGQPVLIPGDMGRYSFVLAGLATGMERSFGSTCHGAGRLMSRHQAKRTVRGEELRERLRAQGIVVMAGRLQDFSEEAPEAYKDVQDIVEICEGAGLSRKVAKLRPLAVLKG